MGENHPQGASMDRKGSWASTPGTRRSMLANRGRDTRPEMAVRRLLHAAGARYRVDFAPLGGARRADIVFTKPRIAVFIDGCFWHCCPDHGTSPARNRDYWEPKLQRNIKRDQEVTEALRASGWMVLRFWEHEDPQVVTAEILNSLRRDDLPDIFRDTNRIHHRSDTVAPGGAINPALSRPGDE